MLPYMDFIDCGLRVFALWPINPNGTCGCGDPDCTAAGKHPRSTGWQHTPEWSEEQLAAMEEFGYFETGFGVLCSGLLVIDVDARNGGMESYTRMLEAIPELAGAGMVVETGSGGGSKHLYFSAPTGAAMRQHLDQYPGIDFKSSGFVVGPGSLHKSGRRYSLTVGGPCELSPLPDALAALLVKPERHRAAVSTGAPVDVSDDDLAAMLDYIPADGYEEWVRVGMALHHVTAGTGFELWDRWSQKSDKYSRDGMERRWHGFGKSANPVTFGTLAHYAEQGGWVAPVEFVSDVHFDFDDASLDTSGVDLLRPPGFVGQITSWINSRQRHARETLAVAAALATIASVAGMRYIDPVDGITPNVFLFGVAGSATGKESVLKSHQELLRVAGVSAAAHGGIKSEQEVFRNLIRHQAALYVIDELGETLGKLQNARGKSGASYLEGVIGTMMSIFTKANSFAMVTGDLKEEIRKSIQAELSGVKKRIDENEGTERDQKRFDWLVHQLATIDNGLERPFLNLFGLTTPERFGTLMDYDMAVNGFLGRCVIFKEHEDNPKAKQRGTVSRESVPHGMAATLQQLYSPGFSETPERVERIGNPVEIATRPEALTLLDAVEADFYDMAEKAKETTGLTAIPRRGYEMVAKVSMLLAIPEGLRTVEHVRWAYALIKRDISNKMKLAHSNSAVNKADALACTILASVSNDHGETIGRLRNRCRSYRKEDVDTAVEKLVADGWLREEEATFGKGRKTKKYFAVKT